MRFIELKPRRSKTHQEASRRNSRYRRGIFNRYQAYKLVLKYGRKKIIRWWQKR